MAIVVRRPRVAFSFSLLVVALMIAVASIAPPLKVKKPLFTLEFGLGGVVRRRRSVRKKWRRGGKSDAAIPIRTLWPGQLHIATRVLECMYACARAPRECPTCAGKVLTLATQRRVNECDEWLGGGG